MKVNELLKEDGRIVKGVNTTVDVSTDEIKTQAKKFGFDVDKDGRPPVLKKQERGSSTNVLSNLGIGNNGIYESQKREYTALEWAVIEGGHCLDDLYKNKLFDFDKY